MRNVLISAAVVMYLVAGGATAQQPSVRRLADFEQPQELKLFQYVSGTPRLVTTWASHGKHALEVTFDPQARYHGAYLYWQNPPRDWSGYDALVLDVYNPSQAPIPGYLLVADQAWADHGKTYWNRHNASRSFAPGLTEWQIPVRGLYRGEAGSRNNDLKRDIDPDQIIRVDFGFGGKGRSGRVLLDNLRFVKANRPPGVWAFDFGPPSQSVMLGWLPVSNQTNYTKERGYGWGPRGGAPWNGAARDTTFGTMLTQDFCEAGGYNFHVDCPPGKYRVVVIFENSGYWGGEQAQQTERTIRINGKVLHTERRADGSAHALYAFENIEPVNLDLWTTYMETELARRVTMEADADDSGLTLRCQADRPWGCKLSAVVIWPADDGAAARWVANQWKLLKKEFHSKAVCLDPPPRPFTPPPAWRKVGLIAWRTSLSEDVTPNSLPPADAPSPDSIACTADVVRGEYEPLCVAVRPIRELKGLRVTVTPVGDVSPCTATLRFVCYNTSRGFGTIAYRIRPHTLRSRLPFPWRQGVTREVMTLIHVPETARAGEYRWRLVFADAAGRKLLTAPLRVRVHPVTLNRKTDFLMGFFGLMPPSLIPPEQRWPVLEQTLRLLREHGMNAVSGGPNWRLKGWRNGQPVIDYGDVDRFFALLRKYGFTKPLNGYGGMRFLGMQQRYEKGETGKRVEKESGLPYEQALMRAWQAVAQHARANQWPTIFYAMCDETRVRAQAERELAFMKLMAKVSAAFPRVVRTSGSYSVTFTRRPTDPNDMLLWHQRFFDALDISSLNNHDDSVMTEAKRLGKEIHIYNQGRDRFTFGLYQWCEFQHGVRARWQWHLNILHGYQFFDLDGREPDTAMLCYGRRELYPTIFFERCREGAEDFYLYNTLWQTVQQRKKKGLHDQATTAADALLQQLNSSVKLNQRTPPPGYDPAALKRKVIAALEALKP